jgi:hypothetical protein
MQEGQVSKQTGNGDGMTTVSGSETTAKRQEMTRSARRQEGVGGRKGDKSVGRQEERNDGMQSRTGSSSDKTGQGDE